MGHIYWHALATTARSCLHVGTLRTPAFCLCVPMSASHRLQQGGWGNISNEALKFCLICRCQEMRQQEPSKQAELQGCQQEQQRSSQVDDEVKLSLHHHSTAATLAVTTAAKQQAPTRQLAGQQQRQALRGQMSPKGTGIASGLQKLPLKTTAKAANDDKDAHIVQLEAKVWCRGGQPGPHCAPAMHD